MCMSSPDIPPPPPPPQEKKEADTAALRGNMQRNRGGMSGGSLLTGPQGVASGALSTGRNTLLGG